MSCVENMKTECVCDVFEKRFSGHSGLSTCILAKEKTRLNELTVDRSTESFKKGYNQKAKLVIFPRGSFINFFLPLEIGNLLLHFKARVKRLYYIQLFSFEVTEGNLKKTLEVEIAQSVIECVGAPS
jgi:hypothetical protein